jgi:hypothetical protein
MSINVSEERDGFIFRAEFLFDPEDDSRTYLRIRVIIYQSSRCDVPEDHYLSIQRLENLKSQNATYIEYVSVKRTENIGT